MPDQDDEPLQPADRDMLALICQQSIVMNTQIKYWRGNTKLSAADLGLEKTKVPKQFKLGSKALCPPEVLKPFLDVETEKDTFLDKIGAKAFLGLGRLVPNARLTEAREGLIAIQQAFFAARDRFLSPAPANATPEERAMTYPDNFQTWRESFRPEVTKLFTDENGAVDELKVQEVMESIYGSYPSLDKIRSKFDFVVLPFCITVPPELRVQVTDHVQQQQIADARAKVVADSTNELHQQTHAWVQDVLAGLRATTAELAGDMIESIKSSKTGVHQKTLNRLSKFIAHYKATWQQWSAAVAGHADTELENLLNRADAELLTVGAEQYRNDDAARARLLEGLAKIREQAGALAQNTDGLVVRAGELGQRKFAA